MTRSILGLLIIAGVFALVSDILANHMRVAEIRSIKRELRRYEKAFESVKKVTFYEQIQEPLDNKVELIVKDETDTPLKFGDE